MRLAGGGLELVRGGPPPRCSVQIGARCGPWKGLPAQPGREGASVSLGRQTGTFSGKDGREEGGIRRFWDPGGPVFRCGDPRHRLQGLPQWTGPLRFFSLEFWKLQLYLY